MYRQDVYKICCILKPFGNSNTLWILCEIFSLLVCSCFHVLQNYTSLISTTAAPDLLFRLNDGKYLCEVENFLPKFKITVIWHQQNVFYFEDEIWFFFSSDIHWDSIQWWRSNYNYWHPILTILYILMRSSFLTITLVEFV